MSDKVWALLSMLGFCIVFCVIVVNTDIRDEDKEFIADGQYTISLSSKNIDESDTYASIVNDGSSMTCPATVLAEPESGTVKFANGGKYGINFWITSVASYDDVDSGAFTDAKWDTIANYMHIKGIEDKSSFTFAEMGCTDYDKVYEIVAPFNFKFNGCNTTNSKITITNDSNNFRITFDDVDNWFCAGYSSTKDETWITHGEQDNPHLVIHGESANAKITDGSAEDVIGYASPTTIVYLEVLSNGKWSPISLKNWLSAE